ncbi:MAG TPA: hypothetical protein VNG94_02910, partial [Pyrinomonadaceae bacterium]|nr:hypothetical protein [Pyrinomonadaceae bacterium]
ISEFSSQPLACMGFGVVLILALTAGRAPLFAQGFSVENKSAPSVVGAGTFVSLEAKFTIAFKSCFALTYVILYG